MIFYLDNGDKFHIFMSPVEVIFVLHSSVKEAPMGSSVRWMHKNNFEMDYLKSIISYLKSPDLKSRRLGKAFLEEMLKVKIHGDVNER